jgi:type IVB pilus formation R64 PilN family outer membrane protein
MKFKKNLLVVSLVLSTFGCSTTHTEKFEDEHLRTKEMFEEKFPSYVKKATPKQDMIGQEHQGYYVADDEYFIERQEEEILPIEFNMDTAISFDEYIKEEKSIPANLVSSQIFKKTGIKVEFAVDNQAFSDTASNMGANANGLPANPLQAILPQAGIGQDSTGSFNMNNMQNSERNQFKIEPIEYEGQLRDVLDYIGVVNNLKWKYDESSDKVFFYEQSVETFYIYEQAIEIKADNTITTETSSQGGGSGGGGAQMGNNQQMQFTKEENAWEDIENELEKMLSAGKGKIAFNTRQGTVVVQDNDFVLSQIRDRIEKINAEARRTVTIDFSIVNVKINDSNNLGINWSYVNDSLKSSLLGGFDLSTGLGNVSNSIENATIGQLGTLEPLYNGNFFGIQTNDNFNVLLGILNQLGSVNISTRTTFPTLNNHPMSFQITQNADYVASIDRETNSETGDENVSTEIDTVKDGVTLTVTPRIIGEEVRLEYSMSLNVNDGLVQAPGIDGVQLSRESNKDFNQSIIANNGQTTVVMAYQKEDSKTSSQGPFSDTLWFLGGNESYSTDKEIVVITATPFFELK